MLLQKISLSFVIFACVNVKSSAEIYVNRTTKYGKIFGNLYEVSNIKAEVYLGVPYTQPPIGNLRFEYPSPPNAWSNVLNCTKYKHYCPQVFGINGPESEDCLYLNIFVPYEKTERKFSYPVLVWIHGGSYLAGSANKFPINSTITNLVSDNIIVVFVNYRLGPLGFLTLANASLPGNYGLEDQLFALKWVNGNIHYFNGDPNRVTLTGESAGGASVSFLAISNKARGLFQRVMPQSGCSLSTWAISHERTVRNSKHFMKRLNCTAAKGRTGLMTCLRNITWQKFTNSLEDMHVTSTIFLPSKDDDRKGLNHGMLPYFTPVVDKYRKSDSILDDSPEKLLQNNSNMTILIGVTNFEELEVVFTHCLTWSRTASNRLATKQFMSINLDLDGIDVKFPYSPQNDSVIDWEVFLPASLFKNTKLAYQTIEMYYNVKNDLNITDRVKLIAQIGSDCSFKAPAVKEAKYYAKNNNSVYFYYYSEEKNKAVVHDFFFNSQECGGADDFQNAAGHGHDLARLFQSGDVLFRDPTSEDDWDTGNLNMTKILSNMITNFVKTGNPNGNQYEQKWSKFTEKEKLAYFLHTKNPKMEDIEIESNYKFWYEILPIVENLNCS